MSRSRSPLRGKRARSLLVAGAAAALLAGAAQPAAAIKDHPLPTPNAGLGDYYWRQTIVRWQGALWFAQANAGALGRIDRAGRITETPLPVEAGEGPSALSAGADGLWMLSDTGRKAVLLRADGSFTGFDVPTFIGADALAADPSASGVWLADHFSEQVLRVTASGPTAVAVPLDGAELLARGSDGAMWVGDYDGAVLQRITASGEARAFPLPGPCRPSIGCALPAVSGLVSGPDGRLWYTRKGLRTIARGTYAGMTTQSAVVGRMATSGAAREWDLANPKIAPHGIVAGPDRALWFATADGLGRVTTSGRVRLFDLPGGRTADSIAFGPDRAIWFADARLNRISRITMREAIALGGAEIRSRSLRLRGGAVPVKLACPLGGGRCRGRVTVAGAATIASASYAIPAGRSRTVAAKAGRRAAASAGRTVTVGVRQSGGRTGDVVQLRLRR